MRLPAREAGVGRWLLDAPGCQWEVDTAVLLCVGRQFSMIAACTTVKTKINKTVDKEVIIIASRTKCCLPAMYLSLRIYNVSNMIMNYEYQTLAV